MSRHQHINWTYSAGKPKREYIDPRIAISRQIGWHRSGIETSFSVPEPDNYNRAVITKHPVECVGIEDQVIYLDRNKNHWVTVLYVPEDQQAEYDSWLSRLKPVAHWQHTKAPKLRKPRSILM
jgi:hypothetical protein